VIGQAKIQGRTRNTITTMKALLEDLRVTRDRGWALDDEEVEEGLRCVAAPIFDRSGAAIAAIGILAPAFRLPYDRIGGVAARVMKEAHILSAESGYGGANLASDGVRNRDGMGTRGASGAAAIEANRAV
jgi:DNA-binding IclR family transcriptional regulator